MSGWTITGARRVIERYGAGVYRFPNDRGLSVATHRAPSDPSVATGWDAVEVEFFGPGAESFHVHPPLRFNLDDDELADMALDVRRTDDA